MLKMLLAVCALSMLACESEAIKKYREAKDTPASLGVEALRSLVQEDRGFAQAHIDLAERFLADNQADSASSHLNEAMRILRDKRRNELESIEWHQSFSRAARQEAELRCLRFMKDGYGDGEDLERAYDSLLSFIKDAATIATDLAGTETFKSISDKLGFLSLYAIPLKLDNVGLIGMREEDLVGLLGEPDKQEGEGTLTIAGRRVPYDYFLKYGSCLVHNRTISQEYTECTMAFIRQGICTSVRKIPGIRMQLKYDPSVQAVEAFGDYLMTPIRDLKPKSEKRADFYPFVQWIISFENRGGYLAEVTTLESEAVNFNDGSRAKNYVLDYFISRQVGTPAHGKEKTVEP
jgi:hypothetical protein